MRRKIIVILICFIFSIGCQNTNITYCSLNQQLLNEINTFYFLIESNHQDSIIQNYISFTGTTSIIVDMYIYDQDTCVDICVFDTNALCNKERVPLFEYNNCIFTTENGTEIFISDKFNLGILYNETLKQKCNKRKVRFNDGLFRHYYFRNGNLIFSPLPDTSDELLVIDI